MKRDLHKIKAYLDSVGLTKEGNLLGSIIKTASEDDEFSYPDYSSLPREPEEDPYEEAPQKKRLSHEEWKKERRTRMIKSNRAFQKRLLDHIISSAEKSTSPVNLLKAYRRREEERLNYLKSDYEEMSRGGEGPYGEKDIMLIFERILLSEKMIEQIQSLIEERE